MPKKVNFNKPPTTNNTYDKYDYDRTSDYNSYSGNVQSSPRTSYCTNSNTADYPKSNRFVVSSFCNLSGGTYTSSGSSYNK
jgi:hypothetical protein